MDRPDLLIKDDWLTAPNVSAVMLALCSYDKEPAARYVGGCVRDALANRPVTDIDIATVHEPARTMDLLHAAGIKVIPTGIDHGTVTAVSGGQPFEITTLRKDVETFGRRAVVAFTADWAEDAQRRDFTINTLLADRAGTVYDPLGCGVDDLRAGRVVFVGDPATRIAEDYLRIPRFFRFQALFGKGDPDPAALAACRQFAGHIGDLSRERITAELLHILDHKKAAATIIAMLSCGVLSDLIAPDWQADVLDALIGLQHQHDCPDIVSRLLVLSNCSLPSWQRMAKGMALSGRQLRFAENSLGLYDKFDRLDEHTIKTAIYEYGNDLAVQSILLRLAMTHQDNSKFLNLAMTWQAPEFPLNGEDLKSLGISDGPAMGALLKSARTWWIDQDFQPTRAMLLRYAENHKPDA